LYIDSVVINQQNNECLSLLEENISNITYNTNVSMIDLKTKRTYLLRKYKKLIKLKNKFNNVKNSLKRKRKIQKLNHNELSYKNKIGKIENLNLK